MKNYQRQFVRAPLKESILFEDDSFVYKAKSLNISEGGLLLSELPHFPAHNQVPLLIPLPQFPFFKNFDLLQLRNFSMEIWPKKIIRLKAQMVRQIGRTEIDEIFLPKIGIQFGELPAHEKKLISDYVSIYASNLVHLMRLMDNLEGDRENREKVQLLCGILQYRETSKLSLLRRSLYYDYKNLQP